MCVWGVCVCVCGTDYRSPIAGSNCLLWDLTADRVVDTATYPHPDTLLPRFVKEDASDAMRLSGYSACSDRHFVCVVGETRNTIVVYQAPGVVNVYHRRTCASCASRCRSTTTLPCPGNGKPIVWACFMVTKDIPGLSCTSRQSQQRPFPW